MGYKLFCDRCGCEIRDIDESIKIDAAIFIEKDNRMKPFWKYYHADCFNYEFSTDIRKLAKVENENVVE